MKGGGLRSSRWRRSCVYLDVSRHRYPPLPAGLTAPPVHVLLQQQAAAAATTTTTRKLWIARWQVGAPSGQSVQPYTTYRGNTKKYEQWEEYQSILSRGSIVMWSPPPCPGLPGGGPTSLNLCVPEYQESRGILYFTFQEMYSTYMRMRCHRPPTYNASYIPVTSDTQKEKRKKQGKPRTSVSRPRARKSF